MAVDKFKHAIETLHPTFKAWWDGLESPDRKRVIRSATVMTRKKGTTKRIAIMYGLISLRVPGGTKILTRLQRLIRKASLS